MTGHSQRPMRCKYCQGALDVKGVCTVCGKQTPMPYPTPE